MPSYVTYHIFAATVQRVTSDSVAHIASSYPAAYRWGSQGPDPLALYHAPFPSALRRLANRVCTEPPAPLFESLCKARRYVFPCRLHSRMYLDSARTMRSAA